MPLKKAEKSKAKIITTTAIIDYLETFLPLLACSSTSMRFLIPALTKYIPQAIPDIKKYTNET
jgi:hypothetical protein